MLGHIHGVMVMAKYIRRGPPPMDQDTIDVHYLESVGFDSETAINWESSTVWEKLIITPPRPLTFFTHHFKVPDNWETLYA